MCVPSVSASQEASLASWINTLDGAIVHPEVADALDRPLADLDVALSTGG
jgi:hypothetical protein